MRDLLTRRPELETVKQALASCDDDQQARLGALETTTRAAVHDRLLEQDRLLGLSWATTWSAGRSAEPDDELEGDADAP